jgi:hypothetical protein
MADVMRLAYQRDVRNETKTQFCKGNEKGWKEVVEKFRT